MKGRQTPPAAGPLRCVYCSTELRPGSLQDETFGFAYNAHQCPTCGKEVLTLEQLDDYNALRDEARGCLQRRKIQRIGNSFGVTLPATLRSYVREGMQVEVRVLDPKTIQLKIVSGSPPCRAARRTIKKAA